MRESHLTLAAALTVSAALAAAVAASGAGLVVRHGAVDTPGERSSHRRPTPTSGGLAVLAAVAAGGAVLAVLAPATACDAGIGAALGGGLFMGLLGAADDRRPLDPRLKLAAGVLAALAVAMLLPAPVWLPLGPSAPLHLPVALAKAGAVLWLVTVANAVNFMDGADGLVTGGLPIAFGALGAAAAVGGDPAGSAACALACAAWLGLLPWNLAGRLFQGDAGALAGGFLLAALCLAEAGRGAAPLLFGPLLLLPWLTDVLLTLLRRARARRPLLSAHREHLYQRWLQATGRPHLALAWRDAAVGAAAAAAALGMTALPWRWQGALFAAAAVLTALAWTVVSRDLDRKLAG